MIQRWFLIAISTVAVASSIIHATPNEITWPQLEDLNFETGEMPDHLRQYHEQTIKVAGFIVPLEMEDTIEEVIEFLLVPDPLACIHVPPPPPKPNDHGNHDRTGAIGHELKGGRDCWKTQHRKNQAWRL